MTATYPGRIKIQDGDALILVDVQRDFLPGGALGVPDGDQVIPALNRWIAAFEEHNLPIFATRDWHPANHCSFREQGGPWPPHCVAQTSGAEFDPRLALPERAVVISKATHPDADAYSGFQGTDLAARLRSLGVSRLFVGGLATDYCVLNTVLDGLSNDFEVVVLSEAIRPVNVTPDDGARAEQDMRAKGAVFLESEPT